MDKSPPHYIGCTYPGNERYSELPVEAPRKLLEDTLDALGSGAFGPVGIDLLYQASTQSWTVIEVQPAVLHFVAGWTSTSLPRQAGARHIPTHESSGPTATGRFFATH